MKSDFLVRYFLIPDVPSEIRFFMSSVTTITVQSLLADSGLPPVNLRESETANHCAVSEKGGITPLVLIVRRGTDFVPATTLIKYGSKIIGLTKENTGILIKMLLRNYIKEIRKRIQ